MKPTHPTPESGELAELRDKLAQAWVSQNYVAPVHPEFKRACNIFEAGFDAAARQVEELRYQLVRMTDDRNELAEMVAALGKERDTLRAQAERLAVALRFYANGNWSDGYPGGIKHGDNILDMGEIAQEALSETGERGGV